MYGAASVYKGINLRGREAYTTVPNMVVAALAPYYATEVRDLLLEPPEEEPYTKLKDALIARTQKSEQMGLRELLSNEELGDQEPSKLLRRMQQLLGDKQLDGSLQRELFVSRLPTTVRLILASAPGTASLEDLAKMADKVVESTKPLAIQTVQAATPDPAIADLRQELSTLTAAVQALTTNHHDDRGRAQNRGRSGRRDRSKSRGRRDRSSSPPHSGVCFYHHRFGEKARKCEKPCSFKSENSQAGQ